MNPDYSDVQREKIAGHERNRIHAQHYAGRNAGVDGQAAYLGTPARLVDVAQLFRQYEFDWVPQLWQSLPIDRLEKLVAGEKYQELQRQLNDPSRRHVSHPTVDPGKTKLELSPEEIKKEDTSTDEERDGPSQKLRSLRRQANILRRAELVKFWSETQGGSVDHGGYKTRGVDLPFSRVRPLLPLRHQLSNLLLTRVKLRSPEGKAALCCLITLHQSPSEVHRAGLEPHMCPCKRSQASKTYESSLHICFNSN